MQRHLEAVREGVRHSYDGPPEKLKNDRKKLEAAKAMDKPKTIWIVAESAGRVAEREREACGDDDDDRDDARHRPLDGFEDGLQRAFPRH